jgi:hypothetical protein
MREKREAYGNKENNDGEKKEEKKQTKKKKKDLARIEMTEA